MLVHNLWVYVVTLTLWGFATRNASGKPPKTNSNLKWLTVWWKFFQFSNKIWNIYRSCFSYKKRLKLVYKRYVCSTSNLILTGASNFGKRDRENSLDNYKNQREIVLSDIHLVSQPRKLRYREIVRMGDIWDTHPINYFYCILVIIFRSKCVFYYHITRRVFSPV